MLSSISPVAGPATSNNQQHGDLNNTGAVRPITFLAVDPGYARGSLAIAPEDDDPIVREKYRPYILEERYTESDWVMDLELSTVLKMAEADLQQTRERLKVLVLFGSLRRRSFSRLLALEASRILWRLGCDVRVFDPTGLPVKDDVQHLHPKVQELRDLSRWSDGHVWVSPEQHGALTGVFKNQIDWIPLSTGSVRPTQGRTLAIAQVNGGSQSFNAVNALRILGRWMRMFTIPNQSSIPKAYTQFTDEAVFTHGDSSKEHTTGDGRVTKAEDDLSGGNRLKPSSNRDRVVDCMEEFLKYTILMRPHFGLFGDRYSERREREAKEEAAAKDEREAQGKDGAALGSVNGVQIGSI